MVNISLNNYKKPEQEKEPDKIVEKFLTQTPQSFSVAKDGPVVFNSVLIDIDGISGKATNIERVDRIVN